ncbi:hypothetical protein SLEP1_g53480 [Rubroshorea leprosula]|uniref:NB-ARC domain-containing protein n=1 Tax=Rubroshorea leprosula TaxID=152421 RepID=A0AAV5MAH3_9ROSI|nr:hypothetical protein SLEP1_g53480 [Rubroshorea leprosula]
MDSIKSAIDIVKDVGPTVRRYVKYQFCRSDYVDQFVAVQKKLERQLEDVEDLTRKGGCFTYICSSRKLDKKTQALNEGICMQGENYTKDGESLVIDDHSIEYCTIVFKEKQEQLKLRQKDIEAKLETQRMQPGKIARKEVEDWMEKACHQIAIKVEDLISQGECSSSSNLEKKTEELKQTFTQGEKYTNAVAGMKCKIKFLEWLKGDEVTRIAVWGMGGVGKTTIMKEVHNQLLKEPKFNKVIWVKVSKDFDIIVQQKKTFDILKFQKRIANSLELKLELEDHKNETKLAGLISQKLRQSKSVLILDDVWQQFCLEDVGIPNLDGNNGCKLVLTTRLQDVAHAMECEVISVNPLPPKEAFYSWRKLEVQCCQMIEL